MRVLLTVLHHGLLRNFESVVGDLASRGHEVWLAAEEPENLGGAALARKLQAENPGVRLAEVPSVAGDSAARLSFKTRLTLDYLRFAGPRFRQFPKLRERMEDRVPPLFLKAKEVLGRVPLQAALALLEREFPPSPALVTWLDSLRPDILLLASLTHYRSRQPDVLRAAIDARIRTAACVYSWDHLSSKALLRDWPDTVMVWNDTQRKEAVELHGIPAERIAVTGAQCYDQWFGRQPSRDHATFCRDTGLDPQAPFLLYVCSALTPSPNEPAFVVEWVEHVRASGDVRLKDMGVLIRPHPEREHEWNGIGYQHLPNVVLRGRSSSVEQGKDDYFDALFHASAVVGLVTSSFLEAAIVGRPVLTLTLPHFRKHQEGVQHFRYLTEVEGGLLEVARDLPEHLVQLAGALRDGAAQRARQERFLQAFVRPGGLSEPSTPTFVRHVESLVEREPRGQRCGPRATWLVPRMPRVIRWAEKPRIRRWLLDAREREREDRAHRRAAEELEKKRLKQAEQDRRFAEKRAAKDRQREAEQVAQRLKEASRDRRYAEKQKVKARQRRLTVRLWQRLNRAFSRRAGD